MNSSGLISSLGRRQFLEGATGAATASGNLKNEKDNLASRSIPDPAMRAQTVA
jgi:hypothetical protein